MKEMPANMMDVAVAGAGLASALIKRKRESHADKKQTLTTMVSATEYGDGRRARNYVTRLHAAKYLKCDPLLKELFFPVLSIGRNFGFCSVTGGGLKSSAQDQVGGAETSGTWTPTNVTEWTKASGVYRGVSMFTIRSDYMDYASDFKLSPKPVASFQSGVDGSVNTGLSPYRRFNNGPLLEDSGSRPDYDDSTPPTVYPNPPTLLWDTRDPSANQTMTKMQISEVGNMSDVENRSVNCNNFLLAGKHDDDNLNGPGTVQSETREGNPAPSDSWTGGAIGAGGYYYQQFKDSTIRIADGCLVMDVTNGKTSSCVLELVLHAQSKQNANFTPQEFINEVYTACAYQQTQRQMPSSTTLNPHLASATEPGGWQCLWDPEYPLLSLKSAHCKKANDMYREVHRSVHILAPGQSKQLKVYLGSLYYGLGNKTLDSVATGANQFKSRTANFQAGTILVSLGHSGVNELTMPTVSQGDTGTETENLGYAVKPDTQVQFKHTYPGAGFWIGKQRAPSEIVVNGKYTEKFYPTFIHSVERNNYDDYSMRPAYTGNKTMPSGLPVQQTIGVVQANDKPVAVNVSSAVKTFKEEL